MLLPDKWDSRCPKIEELDRRELIQFLLVGAQGFGVDDGDFEQGFCISMVEHLDRRSRITVKQYHVIKRLLPKLWDNDPALWRPIDEHDYEPDPDPDCDALEPEADGEADHTSGGD